MSSSNCCFLTCIQVSQEAGQVVWYSHLFQNFPQFIVIHTVKGFGLVNKSEINVFLELSCFINDPTHVGNLISGSSAFSKTSLKIWKLMVHVLLKPELENFEHYFSGMWDEGSCEVVWAFFGIAFLRDWDENWPFPVLWPLLSFPNFLAYWVQHFHSISSFTEVLLYPQPELNFTEILLYPLKQVTQLPLPLEKYQQMPDIQPVSSCHEWKPHVGDSSWWNQGHVLVSWMPRVVRK